MAIGDLLYEKVIDFSTNPTVLTSLFGTGITAAYEPTSKTLQASNGLVGSGVILTGEPFSGSHDCELELTIKMTADPSARKHFGAWLLNESGTVPTGYRIVGLDTYRNISRFDNTTETALVSTSDTAFIVNQSYKLLIRKVGSLIDFFVDDVRKAYALDSSHSSLRPGIFLYGCTVQISRVVWRHLVSAFDVMEFRTLTIRTTPANQEPRSQFQPQDVAWQGGPGYVYPGPMLSPPVRSMPLCKGGDLAWVRDGVQNVLQGYIESTVTISGVGVRRRVLLFDQAGNLEGETYSRASDGKYRFDRLWLNRRYMLVAQDEPAFGPADYNAVAADYQLPTPYAPGEGVGLTGG